MTSQPPDLTCPDVRHKMREVAENATPGPWQWHPGSDNVVAWNGEDIDICAVYQDDADTKATGEFIATFNPQTILALLDAYEASARDAEILRTAMERLARAPGCGCSPICRCGEGEWTRYELEGRMGDAQQALKDARHATQGD